MLNKNSKIMLKFHFSNISSHLYHKSKKKTERQQWVRGQDKEEKEVNTFAGNINLPLRINSKNYLNLTHAALVKKKKKKVFHEIKSKRPLAPSGNGATWGARNRETPSCCDVALVVGAVKQRRELTRHWQPCQAVLSRPMGGRGHKGE